MKSFVFLVLGASLFCLGGCGGTTADINPFFGTFSGTWTSTNGFKGTVKMGVSQGGAIGGTMVDTSLGRNGTISGKIDDGGNVTATIKISSEQTVTESGKFALTGSGFSGKITEAPGGRTDSFVLNSANIFLK